MTDCNFCQLLAGEGPVSYVCQDEKTVAFMDIAPLNPGQIVVIPRVHAPYLSGLDDATSQALFLTTTRVCAALRQSDIPLDGINLFLADGEAAGQEVFHVHFIVIPRRSEDTFKISGTWEYPPREVLDQQAGTLWDAWQALFPAA